MRSLLPLLGFVLGGAWQLLTGRTGGRSARRHVDGRGDGL